MPIAVRAPDGVAASIGYARNASVRFHGLRAADGAVIGGVAEMPDPWPAFFPQGWALMRFPAIYAIVTAIGVAGVLALRDPALRAMRPSRA